MSTKKSISPASAAKTSTDSSVVKASGTNEIEMLKVQMEEQKKQIETLTNALLLAKSNSIPEKSEKYVRIGSREINGTPLTLANRIVLVKYGEQNAVKLKEDEVRFILNSPNVREYLSKGILFFLDESDYKYFDIVCTYDMSDSAILDMIKKSPNDMINDFVKFTNNKYDAPVTHCLLRKCVS